MLIGVRQPEFVAHVTDDIVNSLGRLCAQIFELGRIFKAIQLAVAQRQDGEVIRPTATLLERVEQRQRTVGEVLNERGRLRTAGRLGL